MIGTKKVIQISVALAVIGGLNILFFNAAGDPQANFRPIQVSIENRRDFSQVTPKISEQAALDFYRANPNLYDSHASRAENTLGWEVKRGTTGSIDNYYSRLYTINSEGLRGNFSVYGYHGTSDAVLESLLKYGLDNTRGATGLNQGVAGGLPPGTVVTYAADINYAGNFAGDTARKLGGEPVLLRFNLDRATPIVFVGAKSEPIPPEKISISYDGVNWRPLAESSSLPRPSFPTVPQSPSVVTGINVANGMAARVGIGTMAVDYSLGVSQAANKATYTVKYLLGSLAGVAGLKVLALGTESLAAYGASVGLISGAVATAAAPIVTTGAVVVATGYGLYSIHTRLTEKGLPLLTTSTLGLQTMNSVALGEGISKAGACTSLCQSTLAGKHLDLFAKMIEAEKSYSQFVQKKLNADQILKLNTEWQKLKTEIAELDNMRAAATANGIKVPPIYNRFKTLKDAVNSIGSGTAKPFVVATIPAAGVPSSSKPPVLKPDGVVEITPGYDSYVISQSVNDPAKPQISTITFYQNGVVVAETTYVNGVPSSGGGSSSSSSSSSGGGGFVDSSSTTNGESNGGDTGTRGGF